MSASRVSSPYWERLRHLFRKHSVKEIARHIPSLLEILIKAASGDAAGAVATGVRAISAPRTNSERERAFDSFDDRLRFIDSAQERLEARCDALEEAQFRAKSEIAALADRTSALEGEYKILKAEIEALRKRNFYLALGLMIVFLLACSGIVWIFKH